MTDHESEPHDEIYRQLRSDGLRGWGGMKYERRMSAWAQTVEVLKTGLNFPKPPARILEIGCGPGDVSIQFAKAGYEVVGVDISPTAIEWAREKFGEELARSAGPFATRRGPVALSQTSLKASFEVANVTDLSRFPDESFAAVVDGNCLHCVIGPDRARVFAEVHRVLKPGGIFYVSHMVGEPRDEMLKPMYDVATRVLSREGRPYRHLAPVNDLISEFRTGGFGILDLKTANNPWWDHMEAWLEKGPK